MSEEPKRYRLSDAENQRIFAEEIVPDLLSAAQSQTQPVVVFVGGQTGAGKTGITAMVTHALEQQGGYINANMDFYTPYHPAYAEFLAQDETTASARVRPDTEQWWVGAMHHAIAHRYNVVIETALRTPAEFEDLLPAFRDGGYRIEVALMAVPAAVSRLGILARYQRECTESPDGVGRYVDPAIHDECYEGVIRAAEEIDQGRLAEAVFVFRRDGHAVYKNILTDDGEWTHAPGTAPAVTKERARAWTASEAAWFDSAISRLRNEIEPQLLPELQGVQALAPAPESDQPPVTGRPSGLERAQRRARRELTSSNRPGITPVNQRSPRR